MNNCKKTIKLSDITTTPIKIKYSATHSVINNNGSEKIIGWVGANMTYPNYSLNYSTPFSPNSADYTKDSLLVYRLAKQLYYQNYLTGSVNNTTSSWDWNQQSTACSGSSEYENRYFPTGTELIALINISSSLFGEQISRNTFRLKPKDTTNYDIFDDGNGNLYDAQNGNVHVGNIIYSQGIVIITNDFYSKAFVNN